MPTLYHLKLFAEEGTHLQPYLLQPFFSDLLFVQGYENIKGKFVKSYLLSPQPENMPLNN